MWLPVIWEFKIKDIFYDVPSNFILYVIFHHIILSFICQWGKVSLAPRLYKELLLKCYLKLRELSVPLLCKSIKLFNVCCLSKI